MDLLLKYKRILFLLLFVWVIVVGLVGLWYAYTVTSTSEDESLESRARTIAALTPAALFSEPWVAVMDETSSAYLGTKDMLYELKKRNPDLILYYVTRSDGVVRFLADSEVPGSTFYSPPGQEYLEAPQSLHDLWTYNRTYTSARYSDRWGAWVSGFASVMDDTGRVVGVVGVDQSSTKRSLAMYAALGGVAVVSILLLLFVAGLYQLARHEEETARLKSDFLGMASHELRSPLSAVRWKMAALARDTQVPQFVRESINDMDRHLAQVVNLSSMFLQFTSLDHNLLNEKMRTEVSLPRALWSAIAKVSIQAEQKKISLVYTKATMALDGVTVLGVEEYISLAIINVINNAIKYAPEKTEITIEGGVQGTTASIAILDRGPGIPKEEMKKMYSPFFRTKDAQVSGKPGSGFGMYATHKVLKFHGGAIHHAPRDGGGTVCTITFPIHTQTVVQ